MKSLADALHKMLHWLAPTDRRAAAAITAQRQEHLRALEDVQRTREHAVKIRAEANEVIKEARRAERVLEQRAPQKR